jgi:hypothetical protein
MVAAARYRRPAIETSLIREFLQDVQGGVIVDAILDGRQPSDLTLTDWLVATHRLTEP